MQFFHKKNNNKSLLIFFSGWALDYNPLAHLFSNDIITQKDLLFIWDYRNTNFDFDFSSYEKIDIISFSYGVFMSQFIPIDKINSHIAICGTFVPISKEFGINPKIFEITLKTLSETSLQKFYRNMFENEEQYLKFFNTNIKTDLDIKNLKLELENIQKLAQETRKFNNITKAIIANNDKIIPTKSQQAYWQDKTNIKIIDCGHFPFLKYSLGELLNE